MRESGSPTPDPLIIPGESKIVFLIMDGLGGLPQTPGGPTELEAAHTPNLDELAARSAAGLLEPLGPGLTPGSGPAHLALFGYDPFQYPVGRGVLEALGVDFPLGGGDIAARGNFATVDDRGNILDRRAGRLATEKNREVVARLRERLSCPAGIECFVDTVKEHRLLLVLRGEGLSGELEDTDPQATGVPPLPARPRSAAAKRTGELVDDLINQTREILKDEPQANMILLRGFDSYPDIPSMLDRFGLRAIAIAGYPMYRGLARLVGMELHPLTTTVEEEFTAVGERFGDFDFFFVHVKATDSRGEDGDFAGKVKVIEEVDTLLPRLTGLKPEVLVVTGDHSTPALLKSHSWHPVPVLLNSRFVRRDFAQTFGETACLGGSLGQRSTLDLMSLALAHAGRLTKFGA